MLQLFTYHISVPVVSISFSTQFNFKQFRPKIRFKTYIYCSVAITRIIVRNLKYILCQKILFFVLFFQIQNLRHFNIEDE